jgi:hypothetical protein
MHFNKVGLFNVDEMLSCFSILMIEHVRRKNNGGQKSLRWRALAENSAFFFFRKIPTLEVPSFLLFLSILHSHEVFTNRSEELSPRRYILNNSSK